MKIIYVILIVVLLVILVTSFLFSVSILWPWLWLVLLIVYGVVGLSRERNGSWAWFLPSFLMLVLTWWGYVCGNILPYLSELNYSRLGVMDIGGQVSNARYALLLVTLVLMVGYIYTIRVNIIELIRAGISYVSLPDIFKNARSLSSVRESIGNLLGGPENKDSKDSVIDEHTLRRLGIDKPGEDIIVCYTESGTPVKVPDKDRYLHMLVVGPTGVGKTSRVLKPMIEQEIKNIRSSLVRGEPRGMTVIEPKGDLAADVAEMARYYNVPLVYIDPLLDDSCRFNPLEGDPALVAEATRTVLRATFGHQQAFFGMVQELSARNTVLLLKYRRGNEVTMHHMGRLLRDHSLLREEVNSLREYMDELDHHILVARESGDQRSLDWLHYLKRMEPRINDLINYFDVEILSEKMGEKIQQFALGLRLQIDNMTGNEYLGPIIGGRSDINLDAHLNRGGILVVNTAMGVLGKLGDAFGQFLIMHFQNAVFRRKGTEFTRARHTLIMDEAHRYINPDFERLLAMGRSFRCECILALQNTSQLLLDEKRSFRDSVLSLCRNKIVFGGMDSDEAKYFAGEFGEIKTKRIQLQYDANLLYAKPWSNRKHRVEERFEERFDYTSLIELPAYHVVYRIVNSNKPMSPGIGITRLSDWDEKFRDHPAVPVGLVTTVPDDMDVPTGRVTTDVEL